MIAVDHRHAEIAQLLREKGAFDDVVTAENGTPITEADPQYKVCLDYIAAIHAQQPDKLRELYNKDSKVDFHDVDWKLWHNSRPLEPQLITGFTRDEHATITLNGITGGGYNVPWIYQLKKFDGTWLIVRERSQF